MKLEIILLASFYSASGAPEGQLVVSDFPSFKACGKAAEKAVSPIFLEAGSKVVYQCTYGKIVKGPEIVGEPEVHIPESQTNGDTRL